MHFSSCLSADAVVFMSLHPSSQPWARQEHSLIEVLRGQVHEEIMRYDCVLAKFLSTNSIEWEAIVAEHRGDLTQGFFRHLNNMTEAGASDPETQEKFRNMATMVMAMVEMHDQAGKDQRAMELAADSLADILQADSLDEADRRMDELAASGGLDPAMMLTMAKAWMSVKESPYTKDEVKEVMFHLYLKSRETAAAQQPPEVRILKHLLTLPEGAEMHEGIEDAFTEGDLSGDEALDFLTTSPARLLRTVEAVLSAYQTQRGKHTLLGETAGLMNPEVIRKLKYIEGYVRKHYT
ncbi:unnamed protein product [Ostreobium quekettii]|uniref:Uncharacterized protein n=1 Tax=Ostreobium quekettii TaxID=121088 RepID=A0A8S1JCT2_9CHLO|nr:unnamed protein product [Ostreobium quekettii]